MTDTYASTAKPPQAATAWATRDGLFVEYPMKAGGPPYIVRFKRTIEGLAAALNILIEHAEPASPKPAKHPAVKRVGASPETRAIAATIVRGLAK